MKVHEYQAKQVLASCGVPTPRGKDCGSPEEAAAIAQEMGGSVWVVKAQIHAGGRGKGGGVKLARSIEEVKQHASQILGMTLVTHQTGPEGKEVRRIFIEEGQDIDREFYFSIVVDRATSLPVIMASREGGMEIEEVAAENPDAILRESIDIATGLMPYQARKLAFGLGLSGKTVNKAVKLMMACYKAFDTCDATMLEINPLMVNKAGDILALDAKMDFDDNALFRHGDIAEMRDLSEEEPKEIEAKKHDLNYITLDGNVGCMVNGAGLAMATMDIIKLAGAEPANFLDVGGGATQERVEEAFKLILSDENVKAVLINIFGGIVRCDMIARGVIAAAKNLHVKVPVVVRLEGTNAEEGLKLLDESSMGLIPVQGLAAAARKVAEVVKGASA